VYNRFFVFISDFFGLIAMPIYEYRCDSCGFQKEYIQRMSDPILTDCPECKKATFSKMVTAAGFQLKGGGWYVTDFKGGGSNTAGGAKKTEEKQSDTSSKSESSSSDSAKGEKAKSEAGGSSSSATSTTASPAASTGTT
jgi:putative FmdB family regulatory protein